jgi:UDP-glucose 4-epimerase
MRWLLLGGDGFIGSHLSTLLLQNKQEVVIYDNCSFSSPSDIDHPKKTRYTGDVGNVTTLSSVINAHKPDIICWLVAFHAYDVGENPFIRVSWLNHILNTVLPIVAAAKSKFVFFSSENVYAPDKALLTENHPLKWGNLKTETQGYMIGEWYTRSLCTYLKIPFQIFRLSNIIGNRLYYHPVVDRLSFIIDNILLQNETLIITNPSQARDYMYINDAANMIFKVVKAGEINAVYNISNGVGVTNEKLIQLVINTIPTTFLPKVVDKQEVDIVLDNSRAQAISKVKVSSMEKVLADIVTYRKGLLGGS